MFQFVWALLSSVGLLLGGPALSESYQVYAFAIGIYESIFKVNSNPVELSILEFQRALKLIFERNVLLQINDPLLI